MNGSKTRQAVQRTKQARADQVRREERCVGHVWRHPQVGGPPRRVCTLCERVEWLTEPESEE